VVLGEDPLMAFYQTKKCRELIEKRKALMAIGLPPARHIAYLIDDYIEKQLELERLKMAEAQLDDRIHCAREFIKIAGEAK
jgi:hypothetical protein